MAWQPKRIPASEVRVGDLLGTAGLVLSIRLVLTTGALQIETAESVMTVHRDATIFVDSRRT